MAADVEAFSSDVGRYPTQTEGLSALIEEPSGTEGWSGPYLKNRKMMSDPWGRPILYSLDQNRRTFEVKSLGADGKPGGRGVDRDLQAPSELTSSSPTAVAGGGGLPASSEAPASSAGVQ